MTVTTRLYCEGRLDQAGFDPERVSEVLRDPASMVWLDLDDPTPESMAMLGREFGFHELALEDCLHPHQRPKIEQYGSYFFLIAYSVTIQGDELVSHEMGVFVGRNYLVTVRKAPAFDLTEVLKRWDVAS